MNIRLAEERDISQLCLYDKHISEDNLKISIKLKRIYISEENTAFIGWLRYNLFWDNIPFMNMLYVLNDNRKKGYGKSLVLYWEKEMKLLGYDTILTSTQSNEYSQHFYTKLGYQAIGGFLLAPEPFEMIFSKKI